MNKNFSDGLPVRFKQNVTSMSHFNGGKWLNDLPQIIKNIEKKWSLQVLGNFPDLSYNFVSPCICENGLEAVIKIGLPQEKSEIFDEARALKLLDGNGAVRLLKFDEELEVLLLEKVEPGENLRKAFVNKKREAVEIAIDLLKKIVQKPPGDCELQPLENWFESFEKVRKRTPFVPFNKAARLLKKLNSDKYERFFLHADFHHDNILVSGRDEFLAIDPKGMIGNLGYEIAVFLNNHAIWSKNEPHLRKNLRFAVRKFSKSFDISEKDLKDWAYAQQVLATFWDFEDTRRWNQRDLDIASIWEAL